MNQAFYSHFFEVFDKTLGSTTSHQFIEFLMRLDFSFFNPVAKFLHIMIFVEVRLLREYLIRCVSP